MKTITYHLLGFGIFIIYLSIFSLSEIHPPLDSNPVFAVLSPDIPSKSNGVGDLVIVSWYDKKVIARDGYDYGVTAMKDTDGVYKMWWTGGSLSTGVYDHIFHASSNDGSNWSEPQDIMAPTPLELTADPSVVKVENTYYMYFTGTYDNGINNDIYLATSTDGIHWTKYPSDTNPQPVITRHPPTMGEYGAGQPSVLFLNGQFVVYYLDQTLPDGLYRVVSDDGITFYNRTYIMPVNDVDIAYCESQDLFLMVRHGQFENEFSRACLHISYDGFTFTPIENTKFVIGPPGVGDGFQLASGIVGDPVGVIGTEVRVIYAAGLSGNSNADTWDLYLSHVYFFPQIENIVYRNFSPASIAKDHYYSENPNSPDYYRFEFVEWSALTSSDPGAVPFFELYHPFIGDHFYTADIDEKEEAILVGYNEIGILGYVSLSRTPDTIALYRLLRPATGDHFYTTNPVEKGNVLLYEGYLDEGIVGYVYQAPGFKGDLNGDGVLDDSDIRLLAGGLAGNTAQPSPSGGDLTGDHLVTVWDLTTLQAILIHNFH